MGHWAATGAEKMKCTWMTLLYLTTSPRSFLFSDSFCFCSSSAACWEERAFYVLDVLMQVKTKIWIGLTKYITCSFLNRSPCVLLFPCFPCFAFQNCFWAEYLFMGHTLKRQSEEEEKHSGTQELFTVSPEPLRGSSVVTLHVWG